MEDAMKQDDYAGRFPRGKRGAEPLAASASFLLHPGVHCLLTKGAL